MGIAVTIARGKFDILTGCPIDPENTLNKIVRAHGNTREYSGILAVTATPKQQCRGLVMPNSDYLSGVWSEKGWQYRPFF
jgi:hypothetical protein